MSPFKSWILTLHVSGDWGEIGTEDAQQNDRASALPGGFVLSVYTLRLTGETVWVVTHAGNDTTIMLPSEH